jgi:hypothetical protein
LSKRLISFFVANYAESRLSQGNLNQPDVAVNIDFLIFITWCPGPGFNFPHLRYEEALKRGLWPQDKLESFKQGELIRYEVLSSLLQ